MEKEGLFYEEDGNDIMDTITYMMEHRSVPRIDLNLEGGKKASIYWAGNILRVDINGLRRV